jgi:uncharacterized protein (TIGR02453 family)
MRSLATRAAAQTAGFLILFALIFVSAGTIHFWQGWLFCLSFSFSTIAIGVYLMKRDPAANARPVGGSMIRIHRDIRFARDKSPCKTFVAAHFLHEKGKEGGAPGYYLHIEPGHSMIGAAIWRPDSRALKQIRDAIVADPKRWQRITSGQEFRSTCGMAGESHKRPPYGYDPNHPLIEAIKRKDFAISSALEDRQVWGSDFMNAVIGALRTAAPFVRFLTDAVGLP